MWKAIIKKLLRMATVKNHILIISINQRIMKSSFSPAQSASYILQYLRGLSAAWEKVVYIMIATNLFCLETLSKQLPELYLPSPPPSLLLLETVLCVPAFLVSVSHVTWSVCVCVFSQSVIQQ